MRSEHDTLPFMASVGERLRLEREQRNTTIEELVAATGIGQVYLESLERGEIAGFTVVEVKLVEPVLPQLPDQYPGCCRKRGLVYLLNLYSSGVEINESFFIFLKRQEISFYEM